MTHLPLITRAEQDAICRLHAGSFNLLDCLRGFVRNRRSITTTDEHFGVPLERLINQSIDALERVGFWPEVEADGAVAPARRKYVDWNHFRARWEGNPTLSFTDIAREAGISKQAVAVRAAKDNWIRAGLADITVAPLVIIESPFAGEVNLNVAYARQCVRDSLLRGEHPIASHLLYTQPGILDDNNPAERKRGIEAGLAWRKAARMAVFYTGRGWSRGMLAARDIYDEEGFPYEVRQMPALRRTMFSAVPMVGDVYEGSLPEQRP